MSADYCVRMIDRNEWEDAMALCWSVFLECEGHLYEIEGQENFRRFLDDETLYTVFLNGGFPVCAAFFGEKMIGVAACRSGPHLSLLFVDRTFQGRGVGTALLGYMIEYLLSRHTGLGDEMMTVNSSPVGVEFYHRRGFKDTGPQQIKDGILFTPMEMMLR
ncbi:MAG: GNAT family N-acetyltransferase [Lachnospiraceae bacterium]|nr:GNAT family N-acetyltransferase [Lachnospiraceae bacterium]